MSTPLHADNNLHKKQSVAAMVEEKQWKMVFNVTSIIFSFTKGVSDCQSRPIRTEHVGSSPPLYVLLI